MKILVTGSHGQVGSCLVKQLSQMPDVEFLAVDREQLDITDFEAVKNLLMNLSQTQLLMRRPIRLSIKQSKKSNFPMPLTVTAHCF